MGQKSKEAWERFYRGEPVIGARETPNEVIPEQLAAREKARRIEEILAKDPKDLTVTEWKWFNDAMKQLGLHPNFPPSFRGNKPDPRYGEAEAEIARAKFRGTPPPTISDLARRFTDDRSSRRCQYDRMRAGLKRYRKKRELPDPPKK